MRLRPTLRIHHSRQGKIENQFSDMTKPLGSHVELKCKGNAVDNRYTEIINLPETMSVSLGEHKGKWEGAKGEEKSLKMFTKRYYMHPSGYSIPLEKHAACVTRSPLLALTHIQHAATRLAQWQWEVSQRFPRAWSMLEKLQRVCEWFRKQQQKLQEIFHKTSKRLGEDEFSNHVSLGTVIMPQ